MEEEPKTKAATIGFEKEPTPEDNSEQDPTQKVKNYKVMLYDYFEHIWINLGDVGYGFDDKDEALRRRDELNIKNFGTVIPAKDHYGVLSMSPTGDTGWEIDCPLLNF